MVRIRRSRTMKTSCQRRIRRCRFARSLPAIARVFALTRSPTRSSQAQMTLLVTRVSDPEPALRLIALESMVKEVRSSTSSMTSVPKPLKFLRPHFATLKGNYESAVAGPTKTLLADVLSLLAMTMGDDSKRESLDYKLLGSRTDVRAPLLRNPPRTWPCASRPRKTRHAASARTRRASWPPCSRLLLGSRLAAGIVGT